LSWSTLEEIFQKDLACAKVVSAKRYFQQVATLQSDTRYSVPNNKYIFMISRRRQFSATSQQKLDIIHSGFTRAYTHELRNSSLSCNNILNDLLLISQVYV